MLVKDLKRELRQVEKYRDQLREELSSTIDELISCRKERNELRAECVQLRNEVSSLRQLVKNEDE